MNKFACTKILSTKQTFKQVRSFSLIRSLDNPISSPLITQVFIYTINLKPTAMCKPFTLLANFILLSRSSYFKLAILSHVGLIITSPLKRTLSPCGIQKIKLPKLESSGYYFMRKLIAKNNFNIPKHIQ